jgi:Fe-S cluster assembly ATP-binding protein
MLQIKNLHASVEGKPVLKGLSLTIDKGQCHAIMGPNGAGKSSLAKILAGHPSYEVTEGTISFLGEDLLAKDIEERAQMGLLLSFQYPVEIPGVSNWKFMHSAYQALCGEAIDEEIFKDLLRKKATSMDMDPTFLDRNVNEGFSGGEKKKNEMLQMAMLKPKLALFDETDSGLDIDALKVVADAINEMRSPDAAQLLITHYQRLLDHVKPDFVHVMIDGEIVKTGDASLALSLEKEGYDTFIQRS